MSDGMFLGIDPGVNGGIAIIGGPDYIHTFSMKDKTERDVNQFLFCWMGSDHSDDFAVIEKVSSSPQMGVRSAFTFGRSYGFLRGILTGEDIPFEEVSPQKWQKELGCLTKGDKNVSKARAQQLFPQLKITHAIADALLLAEYAKRLYHQRNGV